MRNLLLSIVGDKEPEADFDVYTVSEAILFFDHAHYVQAPGILLTLFWDSGGVVRPSSGSVPGDIPESRPTPRFRVKKKRKKRRGNKILSYELGGVDKSW